MVTHNMRLTICAADMSTNMALFTQAGLLGIRPKLFAAAPEPFEADDFYRYSLLSCHCEWGHIAHMTTPAVAA